MPSGKPSWWEKWLGNGAGTHIPKCTLGTWCLLSISETLQEALG